MPSTITAATVTATRRHTVRIADQKSNNSVAYVTTADWAWPLGKLRPVTVVNGSATTGRARATALLTTALSTALPATVTTANAAGLGWPRYSSHAATRANTVR